MYKVQVMVAEDEAPLREMIVKYLEREGYGVLEAADGREAAQIAESEELDLAILDVMMPGLDGFEVCRRIREDKNTPVIILTARTAEDDRMEGFDSGADQYMHKPFSMKELMVRVRSLLKRHGVQAVKKSAYLGVLHLDTDARLIRVEGEIIDLTPREYDLLLYMTDNIGRAMTRLMILDRVWGYDYMGDERTVDTFVTRLRRKLGAAGDYISTVRGVGYRFEVIP